MLIVGLLFDFDTPLAFRLRFALIANIFTFFYFSLTFFESVRVPYLLNNFANHINDKCKIIIW